MIISSISGGGGKTFLSLALSRSLYTMGYAVKTFKKGPDYIDSAWLGLASHFYATNIDPVFLTEDALRSLFIRACRKRLEEKKPLFACIEGNRGLFDGLDVEGSASTAQLARILSTPILLCIDCTKMTRTVAAIIQGILSFEKDLAFLGVIVNRVGTSRQSVLVRNVLETYTDLPVFGILPRLQENPFPERHMGLASRGADLADDAERRIASIAAFCADYVDIPSLVEKAAEFAKTHPLQELADPGGETHVFELSSPRSSVRIGYVRDAALWFYYEENLEDLRRAGAELVEIGLLEGGGQAWEDLDGLFLGGGFPEDYAEEIACSAKLCHLQRLAEQGMPMYAECGGFMLLSRSLFVQGKRYPMADIFPVDVDFCKKPQGLGYTEGTVLVDTPFFPRGTQIIGHEFHYSRCRLQMAPSSFAMRLSRGTGMGCIAGTCYDGLVWKNVWASYTHIFSETLPLWAANFVARAEAWRRAQS